MNAELPRPFPMIGCIVAALSFGASGTASAEDAALRKRFLAEAPAAWKKLESMVDQVEIVGVVRDGLDGPKPRPESKSEFRSKANGALRLVVSTSPRSTWVYGLNAKYGFTLEKVAEKEAYLVRHVGDPKNRRFDEAFQTSADRYSCAAFWPDSTLEQLVRGPNFHIKDVSWERREAENLVRVEFTRDAGTSKQDLDILKGGWLLLDPDQCWGIREHDLTTAWGRSTATVEYGPKANDMPTLRRVSQSDYGDKPPGVRAWRVCEFTTWERRKAKEREFTLSAFGLPEVGEAPKPGGAGWLPWGLFAFAIVAGAAAFRLRSTRLAGATPRPGLGFKP